MTAELQGRLLADTTALAELGHPFHVVDDEIVILCLDHPFIPEGRFASLLVRDKELARQLADGFKELWSKAMRDLREIVFHPPGAAKPV